MTYSSATHALSVNPATGETLATYPWATSEEVAQAITLADAGFRQWRASHRAQSCATRGQHCASVGKDGAN